MERYLRIQEPIKFDVLLTYIVLLLPLSQPVIE